MRIYQKLVVFSLSIFLSDILIAAQARDASEIEQLQMRPCLANKLPANYPILAENKIFKIVDVPAKELTSIALLADKAHCGRFINVSDRFSQINSLSKGRLQAKKRKAHQLLSEPARKISTLTPADTSYTLKHAAEVSFAMNEVNSQNISDIVDHMASYYNRSSTQDSGVQAGVWLKSKVTALAENRQDVKSWDVRNSIRYKQPSLVTVIGKDIKAPAIVIGAHMDTLDGRMPGAGDDASGSASLMEIARILLHASLPLKRPIYFIWYSAEERGLVGSRQVVKYFERKRIPVKAVMQLDMTGFRNNPNDATMWVYQDFTDTKLNQFVSKLITQYVGVPVAQSACGYGCSDHASWTAKGVPAVFPCETSFIDHNKAIHTSEDTADKLTPEHMVNFSKLGLAFAIELALE